MFKRVHGHVFVVLALLIDLSEKLTIPSYISHEYDVIVGLGKNGLHVI
jgi:hypothetical protein